MWKRTAAVAAAAVAAIAGVGVGVAWPGGIPVAIDPTRWGISAARWTAQAETAAAATATETVVCPPCAPCPTPRAEGVAFCRAPRPTTGGAVWDTNWDFRAPGSAGSTPAKDASAGGPTAAVDHAGKKPTATRYILLIRHGQYYDGEEHPLRRVLTPLGRSQASHEVPSRRACEAQSALTGQRLAALSTLPRLTSIVCSTMPRALETADIIVRELGQAGWPVGSLAEPGDAPVVLKADALLEEGNPIPPSPPLAHGHSAHHYWRDGPRIEAAFRRYFHRANVSQTEDSLDVIVCHANVIRYFVVRALQVPPEAWLRISLPHASMTLLTIRPSGHVSLRFLGDAGFIPSEMTSS